MRCRLLFGKLSLIACKNLKPLLLTRVAFAFFCVLFADRFLPLPFSPSAPPPPFLFSLLFPLKAV